MNRHWSRRNAGTHPTLGTQTHPKFGQFYILIHRSTTIHSPLRLRFPISGSKYRIFAFLKQQVFQATKRQQAAPLKQVIDRLVDKSQSMVATRRSPCLVDSYMGSRARGDEIPAMNKMGKSSQTCASWHPCVRSFSSVLLGLSALCALLFCV